jgi:hypothetical protein
MSLTSRQTRGTGCWPWNIRTASTHVIQLDEKYLFSLFSIQNQFLVCLSSHNPPRLFFTHNPPSRSDLEYIQPLAERDNVAQHVNQRELQICYKWTQANVQAGGGKTGEEISNRESVKPSGAQYHKRYCAPDFGVFVNKDQNLLTRP